MTEHWDFIVIGGGAAGYFAAIAFAQAQSDSQPEHPHPRVLILEKSSQVLQKVKISGGGRCNVTHHCFDPKTLSTYYPRGHRSLIGPFHRWGADDTVNWFAKQGVELKTEPDGRMFPVSNCSSTIVECLTRTAEQAGIITRTSEGVQSICRLPDHAPGFQLTTTQGKTLESPAVLLATGGTRLAAGAKLARDLGHSLESNVPSLFAFNIADPRISDLPGISSPAVRITIPGTSLSSDGPLLITHQGMSGPAILKLSAWGARQLHAKDYRFTIMLDWLPGQDVALSLNQNRQQHGKRKVMTRSPFAELPKRLWQSLCQASDITPETTWSQLSKASSLKLISQLSKSPFQVSGKSINKDEFVTCGGVPLREINLKSMQSKSQAGLYFAGEILDIDGITGGFNFQNAWTSGYIAGTAARQNLGHS